MHKFTYTMRTVPGISDLLLRLDKVITEKFIKNLFNRECSETEREIFALPVKFGGLGIIEPSKVSQQYYKNSIEMTKQLRDHIIAQKEILHIDDSETKRIKSNIKNEKLNATKIKFDQITSGLNQTQKRIIESICEKGASNWLTAMPIRQYGFYLDKQSFRDAIWLRYGIPLKNLPTTCVCGAVYNEIHALNCKRGGFVIMRHNDLRDLTSELLNEVCNDVRTEPTLTPITGEVLPAQTISDESARCDVSARGFWMRGSKAFVDVRVFNPLANTYSRQSLKAIYSSAETAKRKKYNHRIINIEHGSFTPLIFSSFGGMGTEANRFYNRIAEHLSVKRDINIGEVKNWMRTQISFSLLKSTILCIRGSRSHRLREISTINDTDIHLASSEVF